MNLKNVPAVLVAALLLTACGGSTESTDTANTPAPPVEEPEVVYLIDTDATTITWKGTMLRIKSHHGQIKATDGKIVMKGEQIVAGKFLVDMNSIVALDDAYEPDDAPKGTRAMLIGHLKSADFFDVENHPTASLHIVDHSGPKAAAEMNIRGIGNNETIRDVKIEQNNGVLNASGKIVFDRQKYNVAWSSGVKDAVLSDDIELDVTLVARAQAL